MNNLEFKKWPRINSAVTADGHWLVGHVVEILSNDYYIVRYVERGQYSNSFFTEKHHISELEEFIL